MVFLLQGQEEEVEAEIIDSRDELGRFDGAEKKEGLGLKMDFVGGVACWEVDRGMEVWCRLGFALVGQSNLGK